MSEAVGYDALLVVSFGGPEGPDDVMPFLENVTKGRGVPRERLELVAEHYYARGGVSPINAQVRELIEVIEAEIADRDLALPIYWGNRNWEPFLEDTIAQMAADGVEHAIAFVTSAYSSYSGCRQYRENIEAARSAASEGAPAIGKLRAFYDHPGFIEPMIESVDAAVTSVGGVVPGLRVLFTAHSIPESMASTSDYVAQLTEASRLVAEGAGLTDWELVYQSRSGPPQVPWLAPDICDAIAELDADAEAVVVVPIGFISDHMEVMQDLDTDAANAAAERGVRFSRAGTVGSDRRFASMVVDLVLERNGSVAPSALGRLEIRPDLCPDDCCPAPVRPQGRPGTRPA